MILSKEQKGKESNSGRVNGTNGQLLSGIINNGYNLRMLPVISMYCVAGHHTTK